MGGERKSLYVEFSDSKSRGIPRGLRDKNKREGEGGAAGESSVLLEV